MSNPTAEQRIKTHYPWNGAYVYCNRRVGMNTRVSSLRKEVTCRDCKRELRRKST